MQVHTDIMFSQFAQIEVDFERSESNSRRWLGGASNKETPSGNASVPCSALKIKCQHLPKQAALGLSSLFTVVRYIVRII